MVKTIQKLPAVLQQYPRSRSALYRDMDNGLFPKPISLGARSVGWPSNEVEAMVAARIAGKSEQEIRNLIASLIASRQFSNDQGAN